MDQAPELRCDGCSLDAGREGSLVLLIDSRERVKTVRQVHVACGAPCMPRGDETEIAVVFSFSALGDVFDYAERIIPAHDWERGTIHRLSRILSALQRGQRT